MRYNPLLHGSVSQWDDSRRLYKGGGGAPPANSTTKQEIPEELKPLAADYTKKATALSNTPYNPYQGQRDADLNQTQNAGLGLVKDRALNGSYTLDNAEGNLNNFISAGSSNPYLDDTYQKASRQVSDSVNSQFSGAGRYGSGANQDVLGRNLGDLATGIYGGAYDADRNRQLQAISGASQFGNRQYQDASQLLNAGQIEQDQAQKGLDFNYQTYQERENDPYKKLAAQAAVFGSNLGGSSKTENQGGGGGGK